MISKALTARWTSAFFLLGIFGLGHQAQALETDRAYGEASYQFLKLALSPRITALAGAGIALWDGGGEAESNPASVAQDGGRVSLGYGLPSQQFGAKATHVGVTLPLGESRLWLGARYLGFDPIEGHNENDVATTSYTAHTWKAQAGYALAWRGLNLGIGLGFAQNHIAEASYSTGLLSLGARYVLWRGLSLGAAATNADFGGSDALYDGGESPFPPTAMQAGLAWTQDLPQSFIAALAVDARTRNDEEITYPAGLEVTWNKMATLRAGYPFAAPHAALTAGLALAWSHFRLQYAFEGHVNLDAGHYMSLELTY